MKIVASPMEYIDRLVRASVVADIAVGGGADPETLGERIPAMLVEWNAMPFLPPAELIVVFDRWMHVPEAPPLVVSDTIDSLQVFLTVEMVDANGVPVAETLAGELTGVESPRVRQAIRARALAALCPGPRCDGSYQGRVADVRRLLQERRNIASRLDVQEPDAALAKMIEGLDLEWRAAQLRTWTTVELRELLGYRLRPHRIKAEAAAGAASQAVAGLANLLRGMIERKSGPKLASLEQTLEVVAGQPAGPATEAVLRRVLPLVTIVDPPWATQQLPTGGYCDVTRRGSFDRLLMSQLAYPEDEFARRMAEGELLFYELEAPPAQLPPRQYALLDHSPMTWGVPRVAANAFALCLADRARERRAEARVFAAGRLDRAFDLDRAAGVAEMLAWQRWDDGLEDLRALLERAAAESKGHPTGADVYVCTEAGRLAELREFARAEAAPPSLRLRVFTVDAEGGRATLWRREGPSFAPVFALSLAEKELRPAAAPEPAEAVSAGAVWPSFPEANWDFGSNVICASMDARGAVATGHEEGEVHLWDAVRGVRAGRVDDFGLRVSAIALNGDWIVAAAGQRLWRIGRERTGIGPWPAVSNAGGIRAGWLPGQFFWWNSGRTLVEYRAAENSMREHVGVDGDPSRLFLVHARQVVYWSAEGALMSADLSAPPVEREWPVVARALQASRHAVADADGRAVAAPEGNGVEVRWLTSAREGKPVTTIEGGQRPRAMSSSAKRLLCVNSNSMWFWSLGDGKLVRKVVGSQQAIENLSAGRVGRGAGANAVAVHLAGGDTVFLHWSEEEVGPAAVQSFRWPAQMLESPYTCLALGRPFVEPPSSMARLQGRPYAIVGGLLVVAASDRCVEFYDGTRLLARFWFRTRGFGWALASRQWTAGPLAGELSPPRGLSLVPSPRALAKMLREGS